MKRILGWMLNKANRDIGHRRDEFYALKSRLLSKYANEVGIDIQHIRKECYSCNSTGIFKSDWKLPETCWSCGGSGVYEEFWCRLQRYELGGHIFHKPLERMRSYAPLFEGVTYPMIEGYIHHKTPNHQIGTECRLWLFLIFDIGNFWKQISMAGYRSNRWTPMVWIGSMVFRMKHFRLKDYVPVWHKHQHNYPYDDLPF